MSAEARNLMSAAWASLEGSVVNGVFPLRRFIGSADRGAVFQSHSAKQNPPEVALKLIPATAIRAELQLARWLATVRLSHPHLVGLFEAGECTIGEESYLYAVMEYADQHLAQLLERRALSENEVRDMLGPALSALSYLHGRKLVHGGLKPSNVLVVGEQLKLSSDTVQPAADSGGDSSIASAYDPPEKRDGVSSPAGDIWALGVTICEALTLRRPAGLHAGGGSIVLPPDVPQAFREMVTKCLSRRAGDRPTAEEMADWLRGEPVKAAAAPTATSSPTTTSSPTRAAPPLASAPPAVPATVAAAVGARSVSALPSDVISEPATAIPAAMESLAPEPPKASTRLVIRAELLPKDEPEPLVEQRAKWRPIPLAIAGVVVLAVVGAGIWALTRDNSSAPLGGPGVSDDARDLPRPIDTAPAAAASTVPAEATSTAPGAISSTAPVERRDASASAPDAASSRSASTPVRSAPAAAEPNAPPTAVHEALPTVPRSASQTITGTIRVVIRVTIDPQGQVVATSTEKAGPSRYFERLSLESAKQWTFTPAQAAGEREMLVRFNFTRSGTTARATAPN